MLSMKKNDLLELYHLEYGATNPILRTECEAIITVTPEIKQLAHDMQKLQRIRYGTGLAAPQIGRNIQLITTIQWKKK